MLRQVAPILVTLTARGSEPAASSGDIIGLARIIDGDTVDIHGQQIR
jgi:hypothetical protein